jgi:hypothetical protein
MAKKEKVYWTTEDGCEIEINDLDNKHLRNILLMLQRVNNLPSMRISHTDNRKNNLEQLRTMLTEKKFISCPRHKEMHEYMQYLADKHHDGWDEHKYDSEYYRDYYEQSWDYDWNMGL